MRSGSINVAGIDLEIAEEGEGSPLLMLHGAGGFDHRRLDQFIARKAASTHLPVASRLWKICSA